MQIRRFCIGDEPALFRVFFSAVHEIASRDYTEQQILAWAPADLDQTLWLNHMRDLNPFVVILDNELVGYADVQSNGHIDHFFVSGFHSRKGVGKLLMRSILQEAENFCYSELTSHVSKTAQSFFAGYAFQVIEHRSPVRRGVTIPNVLMRKYLFRAV
jgi:putative acetyltransferase